MSQSDEIVETGGETSQPVTGEVQLLQLRVGDTQQVWGDSLQVLVTPELQQNSLGRSKLVAGPDLSLSWGTEKLRTRLKLEKFASWEGTFTFTGELKLTTDLTETRSSSSSVSSSAWD